MFTSSITIPCSITTYQAGSSTVKEIWRCPPLKPKFLEQKIITFVGCWFPSLSKKEIVSSRVENESERFDKGKVYIRFIKIITKREKNRVTEFKVEASYQATREYMGFMRANNPSFLNKSDLQFSPKFCKKIIWFSELWKRLQLLGFVLPDGVIHTAILNFLNLRHELAAIISVYAYYVEQAQNAEREARIYEELSIIFAKIEGVSRDQYYAISKLANKGELNTETALKVYRGF